MINILTLKNLYIEKEVVSKLCIKHFSLFNSTFCFFNVLKQRYSHCASLRILANLRQPHSFYLIKVTFPLR